MIWGEERDRLPEPPERAFAHRRVCLAGRATTYRGTSQIVVRDPSVVRLERQDRRQSTR